MKIPSQKKIEDSTILNWNMLPKKQSEGEEYELITQNGGEKAFRRKTIIIHGTTRFLGAFINFVIEKTI